MPKLEPKKIQAELDQDLVWPVYWFYGSEKMKSRELLKRLRKLVLGDNPDPFGADTVLDAQETDAVSIVEMAQSPSLGGGVRLIVVRDAHQIKEAELMAELLGPRKKLSDLGYVVVFLSKDLDARKKFSKTLIEQAAVVPCEEVPEGDREAWIQYLSKRRGIEVSAAEMATLVVMDPWTLDLVDMELEKVELFRLNLTSDSSSDGSQDVFLPGSMTLGAVGGVDSFLEAFFSRNLTEALLRVDRFADEADEALPLLGLLGWNVKQLALCVNDLEKGTRWAKLNPYVADKLKRWAKQWSIADIERLQSCLCELDYGFKQTPLLPLGLWSRLAQEFCSRG